MSRVMPAKKNILLVEDDFYIRDIYNTALKSRGFAVVEAEDGQQAIDSYDQQSFDLVLLDIMLPGVTGTEVLEHIRSKNDEKGHTPVIILSNVEDNQVAKKMSELKPEEYFIKSAVKINKLADRIEKMLSAA